MNKEPVEDKNAWSEVIDPDGWKVIKELAEDKNAWSEVIGDL